MKITVEFDSYEELLLFKNGGADYLVQGSSLTKKTQSLLLAENIQSIGKAKQLGLMGLLRIPNMGRISANEILNWQPPKYFKEPINTLGLLKDEHDQIQTS